MRITEWNDPNLKPEQLHGFYHVDESSVPHNRPYSWYMVVKSADAVLALGDDESLAEHIALAHVKIPETAGDKADHRALHFLWAYADGVLGGAEILRADPKVTWDIAEYYPDMQQFRRHMGRKGDQPIKAVLTRKAEPGRFDLGWDIFKSHTPVIVFTSEEGKKSIENQASEFRGGYDPMKNTTLYALGKEKVEDYQKMMLILRQDYGVRYLDVQGGGIVAGELLKHRLLDEYRETESPTVFGAVTRDGKKYRTFPFGNASFGKDDSPIMPIRNIGLSGNHLLIRRNIIYRH